MPPRRRSGDYLNVFAGPAGRKYLESSRARRTFVTIPTDFTLRRGRTDACRGRRQQGTRYHAPNDSPNMVALQNDDGRGSVRGMRDRWRAERSPSARSELLEVDEITTPIAESEASAGRPVSGGFSVVRDCTPPSRSVRPSYSPLSPPSTAPPRVRRVPASPRRRFSGCADRSVCRRRPRPRGNGAWCHPTPCK